MFAAQRKQRILEILDRNQAVKVTELGRLLQVSEASVRRDLQELEEAGLLRRTHGGAVSNQTAAFEPSLAEKEVRYEHEKAAIASVAVDLIQDGDTVMLDSGSTTLQIVRQWKRKRNVTVVTNALNIAWELARAGAEIIFTGGLLRPKTLSLVGPITESTLAAFHVDKLFLAINGVDLQKGLTTPNLLEAQTKKAMVNSAQDVILVADHSKFGRVTFGRVCDLNRIHCLITDAAAPPEFLSAIEKMGVKVLVAGEGTRTPASPREKGDSGHP